MTAQSTGLRFAADHPTAAGHFPGNPIIPGALVLDGVIAAITGKDEREVTIRSAKFLQPVRPGEGLTLYWRTLAPGMVAFECRLDSGALAVSGRLETAQMPA